MPEAPIGWLLGADALGLLCAVAGALLAYRRPVQCSKLSGALLILGILTYAGFLAALFWQASAGEVTKARPLLIAALVAFVGVWSFACGASALALGNGRAIEWWLEQYRARHPDREDAPPETSLGRLLERAPPAARRPIEAYVVLFAVAGASGLAMPWLLAWLPT